MAKGALDGLRVVELGNFLAAPYCTMILADLGAEVIKIEPPGMGDSGRKTPPFVNGESAGFMSVNRNKLGVTTNLKTEAGVEIARRLAASSDVLVENLRLRTLAGLWPRLRGPVETESGTRLLLLFGLWPGGLSPGPGRTGPDRPGHVRDNQRYRGAGRCADEARHPGRRSDDCYVCRVLDPSGASGAFYQRQRSVY